MGLTKVRNKVLDLKNTVVEDPAALRLMDLTGVKQVTLNTRGNPTYYLDTTDTVSADDDFLVVRDLVGNRFKLIHDFTINIKHAGCSDSVSFDNTSKLQAIADYMGVEGGGLLYIPVGQYEHTGITLPTNVGIIGAGWGSILLNTNTSGGFGIKYAGVGVDTTSTDRNTGQFLWNFACHGNSLSGEGVVFELIGATDNGVLNRKPSVAVVNHVQIKGHGDSGVRFGTSASFGAGNKLSITDCAIQYNGNKGVEIVGQSNTCNISNNVINNNTSDGVYMNFVTSTNCIEKNQFMDNGGYGVYAFSCEEPFVLWNGFNRNNSGAIAFSGNGTKSTEAGVILGNLFGDNGSGAATQREISITYTKGSSVLANYFYGTGQDSMIYLSDYADGISIRDNHWKDLTTETKLELKVGITGSYYTFEDSNSEGSLLQRLSSKVLENQQTSALTIFRNRAVGNAHDFFSLKASGEMNWGSGSVATDVKLSRENIGALRTTGAHEVTNSLDLADGVTAPSTKTGYARIYVDTADGDLKVKFSDGVVKTIVTDV